MIPNLLRDDHLSGFISWTRLKERKAISVNYPAFIPVFKGMAGTTGLEPAASAVTVLRATLERMRKRRRKLQTDKTVGRLCAKVGWP
jgi:hypothetical protein